MATASVTVNLNHNIQSVWETVTSLEHYAWRSDLDRIEVLNEKQFVEYTKEGYATTFTITATELCKRWEFDMDNSNIKGHWIGVFAEKSGQTEISFTEEAAAKKIFMKPFVKAYLKKQQKIYVEDLKRELERKASGMA